MTTFVYFFDSAKFLQAAHTYVGHIHGIIFTGGLIGTVSSTGWMPPTLHLQGFGQYCKSSSPVQYLIRIPIADVRPINWELKNLELLTELLATNSIYNNWNSQELPQSKVVE